MADTQLAASQPDGHAVTDTDRSRTRVIRKPVVLARVGVSDTTLWRLVRAGKFPRPMQLSPGTVGWPEHEVDAWIAARAAERK